MSIEVVETASSMLPWSSVCAQIVREVGEIDSSLGRVAACLPKAAFGVESGYFHIPIAQAIDWGVDDEEWLRQAAITFGVGHLYYAVHDTLVDSGHVASDVAVLMDVAHTLYLCRLADLGVDRAEILTMQRRTTDVYGRALLRERRHRGLLAAFTSDEVMRLGEKAAPGAMTLLTVARKAGRDVVLDRLIAAQTWLCTAFQLHDDLEDIHDDWADTNWTFPITLGLQAIGANECLTASDEARLPDIDAVIDALYLSGGAMAILRLALHALGRARACLAGVDAAVLLGLVEVIERRTRERLRYITNAPKAAAAP